MTDLWAVGVTIYMWVCGNAPFEAPTTMLLMEEIKKAPAVVSAPSSAEPGLASIIEGFLTRDPCAAVSDPPTPICAEDRATLDPHAAGQLLVTALCHLLGPLCHESLVQSNSSHAQPVEAA